MILDGGSLDLADNALIVHYTAGSALGSWNGTRYTGVTGLIASGRNGGSWNGSGIVTTLDDAVLLGRTTLAAVEASSALGLSGSQTKLWKGQTVDATTVLVGYAYAGDTNLSGGIDADDYFQLDSNYNKPASTLGYAKGDIDYDGDIDGDDFFLIDSNYPQAQPPTAATIIAASAAEPAATAESAPVASAPLAKFHAATVFGDDPITSAYERLQEDELL